MPFAVGDCENIARCDHAIGDKLWAVLAGGGVGESRRIPVEHVVGMTRRYRCLRLWILGLQVCIAAAMITVQVGVDDAREWLVTYDLLK